MAEAAQAVTTGAGASTPAAGAGAGGAEGQATASATLQIAATDWTSGFKSPEIKGYIGQKGFKTAEDLAASYQNLEKLKGVPENRLIKLPDKMEGDAAKEVFQRLGTPKEAKEYALTREQGADGKFIDWAEGTFHKNNLTKDQANGVVLAFNDYAKAQIQAQNEARTTSIKVGTDNLRKEWGANYDQNINIATQGRKILGIDDKALDALEGSLGREALFKTLHKLGVSVGEAPFVDGNSNTPAALTPEQAQTEIKQLMTDKKFQKAFNKGDKEALDRWQKLNEAAAPGQLDIRPWR